MTAEMEDTKLKDKILGGVLGLAVADAIGVPVEFQSRESLRQNPVTDMRGYGTYNQPPGTWSDDTSLTLCLLESLTKKGFDTRWSDENFPQPDYSDIMQRFTSWMDKAEYTAHGEVFDVGIATRKALQRFRNGTDPLKCGGTSEQDNGNGALMRILPMAFYLHTLIVNMCRYAPTNRAASLFFALIDSVGSLTHAHMRSQIACCIYGQIAHCLCYSYKSDSLKQAIDSGLENAKNGWCDRGSYDEDVKEYAKALKHYKRLFQKNFAKLPEEKIKSSGYVVDTLEAALWCLLNTDNYKDCVLKAVNLGDDTDTVAAVAGGLAGIFYGVDGIPKEWLQQLVRLDYIKGLCEDFYQSLSQYDGEEFSSSFNPFEDEDDDDDGEK
jgi:ADP-ribosylglycohydrolase